MKNTAVALACLLLAAGASAEETQRYLVATKAPFRLGGLAAAVREARQSVSPRDVVGFDSFDGFAAELTSSEVAALRSSGGVRWIEPVMERHAFAVVATQRRLDTQVVPYGVDAIRAREAWIAQSRETINVAVIDSGVDYNHPELKAFWGGGRNFIPPASDDPMDDNGHGTHVAGTIAAANDAVGVVGVSPNVKLWGLKVLNAEGAGSTERVIQAIDWIIAKKAAIGGKWVVNLSLGSNNVSFAEMQAFERGVAQGIVFVAASGNDSENGVPAPVSFPAGYAIVFAVGAVDRTATIASFSNQGPELDVVAPGVDILSSVPRGMGAIAYVGAGTSTTMAATLVGAKQGTVSGEFVYCGLGGSPTDFPASVSGKIALIKRGEFRFTQKTQNALNAGAAGVVIYNHDESAMSWTLWPADDPAAKNVAWPVTVGMTRDDGEALRARGSGTITLTHGPDDYGVNSGTSMSSPHAAAAAAMLWSVAPDATAADVLGALTATARDLGVPGPDTVFGAGLINVEAAVRRLAPSAIDPSNPSPGSRPSTGRRALKKG